MIAVGDCVDPSPRVRQALSGRGRRIGVGRASTRRATTARAPDGGRQTSGGRTSALRPRRREASSGQHRATAGGRNAAIRSQGSSRCGYSASMSPLGSTFGLSLLTRRSRRSCSGGRQRYAACALDAPAPPYSPRRQLAGSRACDAAAVDRATHVVARVGRIDARAVAGERVRDGHPRGERSSFWRAPLASRHLGGARGRSLPRDDAR
jgi:hypothetical protein